MTRLTYFQTCPGKCSENKNCALCVAFMTGPYTPEECREKCGHVEITHAIDEAEVKGKPSVTFTRC